jgi:hypothetical protein
MAASANRNRLEMMASAGRRCRHVTINAALSKPLADGDLLKQDADLPKQLDPWVPGREVNFSIPRGTKTSATPPQYPLRNVIATLGWFLQHCSIS